jgi:hypothetical protein
MGCGISSIHRFLVIVVIQSTFEKPYLTNVHMEQNSQSVSAFQLLWFPPPINDLLIDLLCLTSLSAISWRPVLVVEEAGVTGERTTNHGQATGKLYHLRVECTIFVIYKAGHAPTSYW